VEARTQRIGRNEALFREVNEKVKGLNEAFSDILPEAEFHCECGNDDCTELVRLTMDVYETIRRDPRHFFVKPGHEIPDLEQIIQRADGYLVVEKHAGEPEEIAVKTDPRR
jgi:hypothetical protein